MQITAAIMAHPKRTASADALYRELSKYPFFTTAIVYDKQNDEWDTGKRALLAGKAAGGGNWHVVIQDDALLTPNFYENIENAIKTLNEKALISLYTGTARPMPKRVSAAIEKAGNGGWLMFHQLLWGVGIVIPADHIEPMLEFVQNVELQYDNRIGEFYCRNGLPVYYCIPSLVDHDDDLDSLIDGHGRAINSEPRRAYRLADQLVTWTNKQVYI